MTRWVSPDPSVAAVWLASDSVRRGYTGAVFLAVGIAVALLVGGPARMSSDAYAVLRETGDWEFWGAVFAIVAAALIAGRTAGVQVLRPALVAAAAVYAMWAVSIEQASHHSATSGWTGVAFCSYAAARHLSDAIAYRDRSFKEVGP